MHPAINNQKIVLVNRVDFPPIAIYNNTRGQKMTYHIKLTVESKEERDIPELTNEIFNRLKESDLHVEGVSIATGSSPTPVDKLLTETSKDLDDRGPSTPSTTKASPSKIARATGTVQTDDPDKTWDFGTKWI